MYGNEDPLTQVVLNGTAHTPVVTSELSEDGAEYVMKFPDYGGVEIDATVRVEGAEVDFAVTKIADTKSNPVNRSEEHTSELQSLMRNSYAVFCLKKNKT